MQNQQNPDVYSTNPSQNYPDEPTERQPNNIEDVPSDEPVPLPPDIENPYPVEDPPMVDDAPMGEVDNSPTIIAAT